METTEQPVEIEEIDAPEAQGDPELADAGKKAIAAERRARAAAEKESKALKARLDELESQKLSKEEAAEKRAAEAEARVSAVEQERLRWLIAARHNISEEDAELFLTAKDEERLTLQAERLIARAPQLSKGTYVPGVGQQPARPPNLNEQIAAAEAEGDFNTALKLKSQVIADLARNTK